MKPLKSFVLPLFVFLTGLLVFPYNAYPHNGKHPGDTTQILIKMNPILEMLDSLAVSKYFQCTQFTTDVAKLNKYNFAPDFVPTYPDEVYIERMARLKNSSPFPYQYNSSVKDWIDMYGVKKRHSVSRMLGLAELYFPIFEAALDKYKMPLELKYLAIVESALNPFAVSVAGATGLWQFIYQTGKMYDLEVNTYIDERMDPLKETMAACEYMQDLYNMYGDWALVLAAYNSGPGNVNKAIRRSGGKTDFWDIKSFLPRETQGYVPAFIAVSYLMTYPSEHNIYPSKPRITYHELDTLMITRELTFEQISEMLNVPQEDIKFLNPIYKKGVIPCTGAPNRLVLPVKLIGAFIKCGDSIYTHKTKSVLEREQILLTKLNVKKVVTQPNPVKDTGKQVVKTNPNPIKTDNNIVKNTNPPSHDKSYYVVKSGEGVAGIASRCGITVDELCEWNNIKKNFIYPGQKLIVKKPDAPKNNENVVKNNNPKPPNNNQNATKKYVYYTVQKGDTLWSIASKKGTSVDEIKRWNNIKDARQLVPGTKIKVGVVS
ncbi:MAG: LysM peptidoglycan-binding domain-containing protein [Bacteroidota bacterium]